MVKSSCFQAVRKEWKLGDELAVAAVVKVKWLLMLRCWNTEPYQKVVHVLMCLCIFVLDMYILVLSLFWVAEGTFAGFKVFRFIRTL